MRLIKLILFFIAVAALAGCAHPYVISPDITKIERPSNSQPIKKNVAYYIAEDVRIKAVETPGGGGDKVTYQPYRDIETAFYKMLSNVFDGVTKLKTLQDKEALQKNNVSYVISPQIVTNSESPSALTWVPTLFFVDLTCVITDANGNAITTKKVSGQGKAEFEEWKKDLPLSGKRASEDALLKMQKTLLEDPELRK